MPHTVLFIEGVALYIPPYSSYTQIGISGIKLQISLVFMLLTAVKVDVSLLLIGPD